MSVIENYPALRPTLLLDFANSGRVHPLIQCVRASTATCWGSDGQIRTVAAHVPRIEFDPATGRCLGLLNEESRTNLFTYSDTYSQGIWAKTNITINEAADSLSMSGLKFVVAREAASTEAISKNLRRAFPQVFAAGSSVAVTWFLAVSSRRFCNVLAFGLGGSSTSIALDLTTGEFQTRNAATGWTWAVRKISDKVIAVTLTGVNLSQATDAGAYIDVRPSNAASLAAVGAIGANYVGDPAMGLTVGPVQIESGSFPTSYIRTLDTAVTRAADFVSMRLAGVPLEHSVIVEFAAAPGTNRCLFTTGNGTDALRAEISGTNNLRYYVDVGGSISEISELATSGLNSSASALIGVAFGRKAQTSSVNGAPVRTATLDITKPDRIDSLTLGSRVAGTVQMSGVIRRLAVYPGLLTASQLRRLTA